MQIISIPIHALHVTTAYILVRQRQLMGKVCGMWPSNASIKACLPQSYQCKLLDPPNQL